MPEGHTIHRLARDHRALLVGRRPRASSPQGRFEDGAALVSGREVVALHPYGKHLWYEFDGEVLVHVHLGLYGGWATGATPAPTPRGALRLRLETDDAWLDLRGPTACELHLPGDRARVLARLGPDPLHDRSDPGPAWQRAARSRAPVAQLLMDQSVLAGVGNVYRAEVLYRAGLDPYRPGRDVPTEVLDAIWDDLRRLMRAGGREGRITTTERGDRPHPRGPVRNDERHYVYRRTDAPCRRCGTPVRTAVLAGRNLYWCPVCQA